MRSRTQYSFRLILLALAVQLPLCLMAQINTDRVMSIGRNALYFEDYVLSIQYFNQVINARPHLAEPYFFRALAKLNLDDYQGAEADCTESIERNPFVVNAYQLRGLARVKQGKFKEAIHDYRLALSYDPENIVLRHNLALSHIQQDDYDAAQADLDTLLHISPRYTQGYLMQGEVALKQKDTLRADSSYLHALKLDQYDPDIWASLATLRLQQDSLPQAERAFDEAIRLSARNAGLYINRALTRYRQLNLRGAMDDYDKALQIDPNHFIGHYNRGLLRAQVGDDNRAIDDFNFVLDLEPDNMMARFNRALLLDRTGDYKAAIQDYSAVIDTYPKFMLGYQYRAQARRKTGDLKGAEKDEITLLRAQLALQTGTQPKQKDPSANDQTAQTRKKSDTNMDNYRKIVVADNEEAESKYKSDYRGKVQDKNVIVSPRPILVLTYYEKADPLMQQILYDKHIEAINNRHIVPGKLLITNREMALSKELVDKHFNAINTQTAQLVKQPADAHHRFARALDFYLVQNFDEAIDDLNAAIESDPSFFPSYFNRAAIRIKQLEYNRTGDTDKPPVDRTLKAAEYQRIVSDLDRTLELVPDFAYAYYNRGYVRALLNDYQGAIADYDACLKLDNDLADAYYNRGLVHLFLGHTQQGTADLSKAGELGLYKAYNIIKRFSENKIK